MHSSLVYIYLAMEMLSHRVYIVSTLLDKDKLLFLSDLF